MLEGIPPCTFLVFEEVKASFYDRLTDMAVGHHRSPAALVSVGRWQHVKRWHVVLPPTPTNTNVEVHQYYCVRSARLPHYQVSTASRSEYNSSLSKFLGNAGEGRVVVYKSSEREVKTDFMVVLNSFECHPKINELCTTFKHGTIGRLIDRYHERDDSRGNRFFDRGYSGTKNRKRDCECSGLVLPSKRSVVDGMGNPMDVEDEAYCTAIESSFYEAMKEALPGSMGQAANCLYMIPPANGVVIRRPGGSAHQYRYAVAAESLELVVACHIDSQNPSPRGNLQLSEMNCPVGCISVYKQGTRCSLIAYGRESVVASAVNIGIYQGLLNDTKQYFDSLPASRREVTPEIVVNFRNLASSSEDGVARLHIHSNKLVYFSPFVDGILQLTKRFNLDTYDRICLLYCCVLSEKPDIFEKLRVELELGGEWASHGGDFHIQFVTLYNRVFDLKQQVKCGVARHQPSANRRACPAQLKRTADVLVEAHHSSFAVPINERSEPRLFSVAVSILSCGDGVHHAGQLLSQHLLIIGACIGVFPEEFLEHGHVCADNEKITSRLESKYSIYSKGSALGRSPEEVGYDILAAMSHNLDSTSFVSENILCEKLKLDFALGTSLTRKDSFFVGQRGLYQCKILRNPRCPILELVTESGTTRVAIPEQHYRNHVSWANEWSSKTSFFSATRVRRGSFVPIKFKRKYRARKGSKSGPPPSVQVAASILPPAFALTLLYANRRRTIDCYDILRRYKLDLRVTKNKIKGVMWYGPSHLYSDDGKRLFSLTPDDEKKRCFLLPQGSYFEQMRGKGGAILYNNRILAMECAAINYLLRYKQEDMWDMWNRRNQFSDCPGEQNFVFLSSISRNTLFQRRGMGRQQKEPAYVLTDYDESFLCMYSCDECGVFDSGKQTALEHCIAFIQKNGDAEQSRATKRKCRKSRCLKN